MACRCVRRIFLYYPFSRKTIPHEIMLQLRGLSTCRAAKRYAFTRQSSERNTLGSSSRGHFFCSQSPLIPTMKKGRGSQIVGGFTPGKADFIQLLGRKPRLRLRSDSYRKLHYDMLERDGWRCQYCGSSDHLQVHHIRSRSRLRDDTDENLITLCADCPSDIHFRLPG